MRQKIVAGNWKMNKTFDEAQKLASEVVNMVEDEVKDEVKVILCPPSLFLGTVNTLTAKSSKVSVAAQNCNENASGAFTGEISASMVKSLEVENVVLGHSERREYFGETDEQLAKKVSAILENGLTPIFCCGETLETRESGKHFDFVCKQLTEGLFHLGEEDFKKVIIAYEPIWAIGTGVTASSEQAQEMHQKLRAHLASKYGESVAQSTSILYGGSCKPGNAKELFGQADVDGGLIGGASLKARDFVDIIKSF